MLVAVATSLKYCWLAASWESCSWTLILASTDWTAATVIVQYVMAVDSATLAKLLSQSAGLEKTMLLPSTVVGLHSRRFASKAVLLILGHCCLLMLVSLVALQAPGS